MPIIREGSFSFINDPAKSQPHMEPSRVPYGAFFVSAYCGSMAQGQVPALFHIQLKEGNAMEAKTEWNNISFSER